MHTCTYPGAGSLTCTLNMSGSGDKAPASGMRVTMAHFFAGYFMHLGLLLFEAALSPFVKSRMQQAFPTRPTRSEEKAPAPQAAP